jgi:uncharacterized membrane protein YraQ (UPF0718 family)/copper chaperone CopZ
MQILTTFIRETINLWLAVAPYLLLGMVIAGLLHIFLGKDFIVRHLGKGGIASIVKATLLGVPLPVCSCGVIPLATALKKDGAHNSSVLSFMVSTPTTGVDSILATYSLMGPLFAVFRPLAAIVAGVALGLADYLWEGRHQKDVVMAEHKHEKISRLFSIKEFFTYTFREIPADIGKWLLVGTVIGAAISALMPADIFSRYLTFPWDFITVIAIGVPLYVCATGSIPIATSLMMKGISPGAALAFLIAGPATNTITISFVRAKLGKRSAYLYVVSIVITAFVMGIIFNQFWAKFASKYHNMAHGAGDMLPAWLQVTSGIVLLALVAPTLIKKPSCPVDLGADFEIKVNDIHCDHCRMVLEDKLKASGVEWVKVDVNRKTVKVKGNVSREELLQKIREAGYNPE